MKTEEALIRAFVEPSRRDRLVRCLGTPAARSELWTELSQFRHLDPRFRREIPRDSQSPEGIEQMLRTLGAPDTCSIVSGDEELDGLELNLKDAVDWVFGVGQAVFVSCISGKLAYYEGEATGRRFILERLEG